MKSSEISWMQRFGTVPEPASAQDEQGPQNAHTVLGFQTCIFIKNAWT